MSRWSLNQHVAIVGGGPAGLGAAVTLKRLGVSEVTVLERESSAGGIPRHCGHPPFGMREFHRILRGPDYARKLVQAASQAGVRIVESATVSAIAPGPSLDISTPDGVESISADRVLLATGVRETPRPARMVSGCRAAGVLTTGALQSMVYLKNRRPCLKPVIIGTELVAFSALLTCRHAGIQPVAMVEPESRITAWRWASMLPRLQGVPVLTDTRLEAIEGHERVTGVTLRQRDGKLTHLSCDGVVFSGQFTAESTLARMGHLEIDPGTGGPTIDQFGRCSDPGFFAAGNLLHPADNAGYCWREGVRTAGHIARSLAGDLPDTAQVLCVRTLNPIIRYALPQRLVTVGGKHDSVALSLRFARETRGRLTVETSAGNISSRRVTALPERRRRLQLPDWLLQSCAGSLRLNFEE